jgi:MoxR-like ATPase
MVSGPHRLFSTKIRSKEMAAARKPAAKKTTTAKKTTPAKKTVTRTTSASKKPPAKKTVVRRKPNEKPAEKIVASASSDGLNRAYIPDPAIARRYVGRKVLNSNVWDFQLAIVARDNGENILLEGDTGSGKTLFGEAVASKLEVEYYSVPCDVSIDPTALFGKMVPTEIVGKFEWQDGPVTQIVRGPCGRGSACDDPECDGGVLNISEVNFMSPKIAASMYSLLDGRRYITLLGHKGEVIRCHPRTLIIADMNPQYRGTMELNAAFKNRWEYKIPWKYDASVEEKLIQLPTVRDIAAKLRAQIGRDIMTPVSTNMLMEFERFAMDERLGLEFAMSNFVAAFQPGEQSAVSNNITLNEENLKKDIKFVRNKGRVSASTTKPVNDDELEEVEFEFEEN